MRFHRFTRTLFLAILITSKSPTAVAQTPPQRIVSLSLASDEILLDLLPLCSGLDRLKAISTLSDDLHSSHTVETAKKIKGRVHSEPEGILGHKPDLVIAASFNRSSLLDLIVRKRIPLLLLDRFSSHHDIARNIEQIGEAIQCRDAASKMATTFRKKIDDIASATKGLAMDSAVYYSPDLSVMAEGTLFDDLLKINHLENSATKAGLKFWPKVSPEALLSWDPRWVVLNCEGAECQKAREQAKSHPVWKRLKAVVSENFIELPTRDAMSTSHYFGTLLKRTKS